jgi:RNA polymerase sigma-70 factor (ECF subfamily)
MNSHVPRLLALLSNTQREVLRLRLVAELSVEEAAAELGSTPEAVTIAQKRALRVLRDEFVASRRLEWPRQPED